MSCDKELSKTLRLILRDKISGTFTLNLTESVGEIIGLIAEERQAADRQGYCRGYNNGFAEGKSKRSRLGDWVENGEIPPNS